MRSSWRAPRVGSTRVLFEGVEPAVDLVRIPWTVSDEPSEQPACLVRVAYASSPVAKLLKRSSIQSSPAVESFKMSIQLSGDSPVRWPCSTSRDAAMFTYERCRRDTSSNVAASSGGREASPVRERRVSGSTKCGRRKCMRTCACIDVDARSSCCKRSSSAVSCRRKRTGWKRARRNVVTV